VIRALWRSLLRLRFRFWQHRRHNRLVIETSLGFPLVVLPGVLNPTLFLTTPVVLEALTDHPIGADDAVLDLGTGSGILAVAAASRAGRVVAVDISPEAVRCARINALLNHVDDRVDVRVGDLFAPVDGEQFELIVCNPPFYRGGADTDFERALYSQDFAERLADGLQDHLREEGRALIVLSSIGDEEGFLAAFQKAGLTIERVARRDLMSEVVSVYQLDCQKTSPGAFIESEG